MKPIRRFLWRASPRRALIESWLIGLGLLLPILPVILEATPLARSLYLVQVPLACAVTASLRVRFFSGPPLRRALKECGLALLLGLGLLGLIFGLWAGLGRLDLIRHSYARTWGTVFFIGMAVPEYLGVRLAARLGQYWQRLRRRRYVWALTHAILCAIGGMGLCGLVGSLFFLANLFHSDIWQIPPESPFANIVFWLAMLLFVAFLLFAGSLLLFLPPGLLFAFLVARTMTTRLETLATATRALRQGSLAARVEVQGEDEIAQLQADFNAMAVNLEKSVLELQAEKDKVWTLLEARRELVAEVSHELRNPAAIILGYSEALRRNWQESPQPEVEKDLEAIQYEATRLQTILNDLLTSSQIETGHLSMAPQALEVTALVRRLVETFSRLAWTSQRVQVTLAAPPQAVFVLADPLRLEQVLVNLAQNAVRHTSPGGLVAFEILQNPDNVCIEVEDTGEGIAAEDLPHIWEKYYQSDSRQAHTPYGVGLGLALVKELTEAMGGRVAVESQVGQGSLFRVYLPAGAAPGEAQNFSS